MEARASCTNATIHVPSAQPPVRTGYACAVAGWPVRQWIRRVKIPRGGVATGARRILERPGSQDTLGLVDTACTGGATQTESTSLVCRSEEQTCEGVPTPSSAGTRNFRTSAVATATHYLALWALLVWPGIPLGTCHRQRGTGSRQPVSPTGLAIKIAHTGKMAA